MPALIPTAEDLERMTPAQRAKIRRYVAKIALELDAAARDALDLKAAQRQRDLATWGAQQRHQARNALAAITPDPPHVTAARRQALLDATR